MIIDYSTWRPKTQNDLGGVNGAIRYIAHDTAKAASGAELQMLHGWNIGTALVFEDAADRAAAGAGAGGVDGLFAAAELEQLKVPRGRPLYVAVDFDIPDYAPDQSAPMAKLGPVGEYLHEFGLELNDSGYMLGVYGGYWCVSRAMNAGLTAWAWQTSAWSGGQVDQRIRLYQPGISLEGGNWDLDLAGTRDWGQFREQTSWITGATA